MPERGFGSAVVLGDGGWGTTLALCLVENGLRVTLWSPFVLQAEELRARRENTRYLPGIALPPELRITADPIAACEEAELAVSVVPTQYLRKVARQFEDALKGDVPLVSATKGLEIETFRRPSEILAEELGERPLCVLSGPSHAEEVARRQPASLVAASTDARLAERVQSSLGGERLRVYTHTDPVGAELGAALKNVIAIAAGISDGLGLGDNAKAALVTRGAVEMARFGKQHGAQAGTFFGQLPEMLTWGQTGGNHLARILIAQFIHTEMTQIGDVAALFQQCGRVLVLQHIQWLEVALGIQLP